MLETAGTKLRRARTHRQLSLADAARATKIRPAQLSDLENDEYSNFANLAYARGFLVSYGKFLHLDVRPYLEAFADANTFGLDDYQYLSDRPVGEYRAPVRQWRQRRKGNVRQLVALAASVVVLGVAVFSFYLYVNYKRLGGRLGTLAEHQNAPVQGEPASGASTAGDAAKPIVGPGASTPAPASSVPPSAPAIAPNNDDNRAVATALAVARHKDSPAALLTQLSLPSVKSPGENDAPKASPSLGGAAVLVVHVPDKNVDAYRAALPKPTKVSNNALE